MFFLHIYLQDGETRRQSFKKKTLLSFLEANRLQPSKLYLTYLLIDLVNLSFVYLQCDPKQSTNLDLRALEGEPVSSP